MIRAVKTMTRRPPLAFTKLIPTGNTHPGTTIS